MKRIGEIAIAVLIGIVVLPFVLIALGCVVVGLLPLLYRLIAPRRDDYAYADYSDEEEPDPDRVARKLGVP